MTDQSYMRLILHQCWLWFGWREGKDIVRFNIMVECETGLCNSKRIKVFIIRRKTVKK